MIEVKMKMLAVVPLLIVASCIMQCASGSCPSGWEQFEQYCYLARNYNLNWQMSRLKCRQFNADLVKINSAEENEFVLQLARRDLPTWSVWIGFHWHVTAGDWTWMDNSDPVYTNWKQNEPNGNAAEPCAEMYSRVPTLPLNGKWNDATCSGTRGLVCKKLA